MTCYASRSEGVCQCSNAWFISFQKANRKSALTTADEGNLGQFLRSWPMLAQGVSRHIGPMLSPGNMSASSGGPFEKCQHPTMGQRHRVNAAGRRQRLDLDTYGRLRPHRFFTPFAHRRRQGRIHASTIEGFERKTGRRTDC